MMHAHRTTWIRATLVITAVVIAALFASTASAQRLAHEVPPEMEGIEIIERLDEPVPMDLEFVDEYGNTVTIGDYFDGTRPVILTLNYYTCPQLCHLTLNGLVAGLQDVNWTIGKEFRIVTATINPDETPQQARAFKGAYVNRYGRESAEDGWAFLTGDQENIKALADSIGFKYKYIPETQEYAHSASITFITPDGRISKYMNDVMFQPRDLRFALVEASQGSIGSPMDRLLLFTCFQFDPDSGGYTMAAWKIMRTSGLLTVIALALVLLVLGLRGSRYQRKDGDGTAGGRLAVAENIKLSRDNWKLSTDQSGVNG